MNAQNPITKSVRLNPEESAMLTRISQEKGVSEAAIMRKFVLDGITQYRLEQAVAAYAHGEIDLAAAARHAGVSVYRMMKELTTRNIETPAESEKFMQGLKSLIETFGGSDALRQTLAEYETAI